jgi:small subunit ribosomal protein S2
MEVDYPIPANDDSRNTINLIVDVIADALVEGYTVAKAKRAEQQAESERIAKESDDLGEGQPKVKRQLRERKKSKPKSDTPKEEVKESSEEAEQKENS